MASLAVQCFLVANNVYSKLVMFAEFDWLAGLGDDNNNDNNMVEMGTRKNSKLTLRCSAILLRQFSFALAALQRGYGSGRAAAVAVAAAATKQQLLLH